MAVIKVYTDGSCQHNGSRRAHGGYGVFFADGHPSNLSCSVRDGDGKKITNQTMELDGIVAGLEAVQRMCGPEDTAVVYTDSMYAINCLTKWVHLWERTGWRTKNKKPVQNSEVLQRAHALATQVNARFVHVQGHAPQPTLHEEQEQGDNKEKEEEAAPPTTTTTSPPPDFAELHEMWYGNMRADQLATQAALKSVRSGCRFTKNIRVRSDELLSRS